MPIRAYHFTPLAYGLSNLALQRLKIARIGELNDPFDLLGFNTQDDRTRFALEKTKRDLDVDRGLICFSKNWQNPLMWSHYAEKHRGVALGFDINDDVIIDVSYRTERQVLTPADLQGEATGERLMSDLLGIKYAGWAYEQEVRVFCGLDPALAENGLYFHDFAPPLKLKEIVLGPLCRVPVLQISRLAHSFDAEVVVIQTELAQSGFEVVAKKT